jgi:hypothetical protein
MTMMTMMAGALLTIVAVEVLKLVRSAVVLVLSSFKEKPEEPKPKEAKNSQ